MSRRALILVAQHKPGAVAGARALAAESTLLEPSEPGVYRETMQLSAREVVVVLEGEGAEERTRAWLDDPVASTPLSRWLPLFDGPLHEVIEIGGPRWVAVRRTR